jgi:hypothetical protein
VHKLNFEWIGNDEDVDVEFVVDDDDSVAVGANVDVDIKFDVEVLLDNESSERILVQERSFCDIV